MGHWERIAAEVSAMNEDEREKVAAQLEALLVDRRGESVLTEEQMAEVERRLAEPPRFLSADDTRRRIDQLRG